VSRLLAQMRRQGIIEMHGGAVRSVDLERLLETLDSERPHETVPLRQAAR